MKKIFFVLVISTLFTFPVSAQTTPTGDLRLTTSPLPINLKTDPGTVVSAQLKVKNDGLQEEKIKVSLMKFGADSQSGAPLLMDREPADDFFDWVSFSEDKFTLPVNEWKTINATFTIPNTASFGYYYAIVFSRSSEDVTPGERQTVITGGTATLVLLDVQVPNAKREVQLQEFSVNKKMFEFLPATFTVKLRNTGNVHIAPRGNIFIGKGDKKETALLEVNPNFGSILPNSPRAFTQDWADGFPVYVVKTEDGKSVLDEQGNQVMELKWDFKDASKLRFGKYTAKLLLIYDDGQKDIPLEGEVSFWVIPWRLFLYAFFIIFVPAFAVYIYMKWRIRKIKKQLQG